MNNVGEAIFLVFLVVGFLAVLTSSLITGRTVESDMPRATITVSECLEYLDNCTETCRRKLAHLEEVCRDE